jgi:hypothetical protein
MYHTVNFLAKFFLFVKKKKFINQMSLMQQSLYHLNAKTFSPCLFFNKKVNLTQALFIF